MASGPVEEFGVYHSPSSLFNETEDHLREGCRRQSDGEWCWHKGIRAEETSAEKFILKSQKWQLAHPKLLLMWHTGGGKKKNTSSKNKFQSQHEASKKKNKSVSWPYSSTECGNVTDCWHFSSWLIRNWKDNSERIRISFNFSYCILECVSNNNVSLEVVEC